MNLIVVVLFCSLIISPAIITLALNELLWELSFLKLFFPTKHELYTPRSAASPSGRYERAASPWEIERVKAPWTTFQARAITERREKSERGRSVITKKKKKPPPPLIWSIRSTASHGGKQQSCSGTLINRSHFLMAEMTLHEERKWKREH